MKPPKQSPAAARKAYGVYINGRLESLQMNPMPGDEWPLTPVFVLPASGDVRADFVDAGAKALHKRDVRLSGLKHSVTLWPRLSPKWRASYRAKARAVLSALNLLSK